jgi:GNAT superfamily N-acetyltransferase
MDYAIQQVTAENHDEIGLFCSRSKRKEAGYQTKLQWIKERFQEGLEYYVLRVDEGRKEMAYRGMVEYMPGNVCWRGVDAPDYIVIHCLWVVGRHKGKGYGGMLVDKVIDSAKSKNMDGVAVITIKRGGWSPKSKLFEKKGFQCYDSMGENYELYALKLREDAPDPRFCEAKPVDGGDGFKVFTSGQCPYMPMTVEGVREMGLELGKDVEVVELMSREDVMENCMDPYGVFHLTVDGEYVTPLPGGPGFIQKEIKKHLDK